MRASWRLIWRVAVRWKPVCGWAGGVYLVVEPRRFGGGGGGGPTGEGGRPPAEVGAWGSVGECEGPNLQRRPP